MEAKNFKCPCCGSVLEWNGLVSEMKCASCGNSFPLETLQQVTQDEQIADTREIRFEHPAEGTVDGEKDALHAFKCPGCGASIVVSETSAASSCPYCGNAAVMPEVLSGSFRPDLVIPFAKDREQAKEAYRNLCKGKRLLPTGFANESQIDKIQGIYVPFWLYDCQTESDITYKATKVTSHRQGNYMITRTAHYHLRRGGEVDFSHVPVNSSTKIDDTLMEAVEPFRTEEAKSYSSAYLSGYEAERYNQDMNECSGRAVERIRASVKQVCDSTVNGYTSFQPVNTQIRVTRNEARNALMPVYLLNTSHKGKKYTFAMNGQSGQIVGDLPVDGKKAFLMWLLITLGTSAAGLILAFFLFNGGVI